MSKKVLQEEFLRRYYRNIPEADISLIDYTAISKPLHIKCNKCGQIYYQNRARDFLNGSGCCVPKTTRLEKLKKIYEASSEFDFVKQIDKDFYIVHHNVCGNDIKRFIQTSLDNPFACKYCNTAKSNNMLSIKEVQERLDNKFFGTIQILDYNGQLEKNHYKCLKCGLIFVQEHICLMQSRGCPKCDKWKSKGESTLVKLLENQNIQFKEQVQVDELPLQKFDFGIYENNKLQYFIEVQGEQHREYREIFKDSLEKIQERDERKRSYCKKHNIPLYEIIYQKGVLKNLDILPFYSTTISAKESTL